MEDTLREDSGQVYNGIIKSVLILVLMEDTLRGGSRYCRRSFDRGLNPCFNGRYSQSTLDKQRLMALIVLILVLMEDTLRDRNRLIFLFLIIVLILVLMEDTLRAKCHHRKLELLGLNPCFNGRYSQRRLVFSFNAPMGES